MSTIVLRSVKGSPLTNAEVDANFTNLNNDKIQIGGTYSAGTANGVAYLNGSKVLTTGSALTFDGSTLATTGALSIQGNTTLGNASTDTVTVNGYMGVGGAGSSAYGLQVSSTSLTGANQYGILSIPTGNSAATTSIAGVISRGATAASSFTVGAVYAFYALNSTLGAGSTITNQYGLYIADQTQGTNNFGIASLVSSGTNKWNIYASGTAANYFAGNVGIGTSTPADKLNIHNGTTSASAISGLALSSQAVSTNDYLPSIEWAYGSSATPVFASIDVVRGSGTSGIFVFNSATTGGVNTERLRIDSSGNLLVGTTTSLGSCLTTKNSSGSTPVHAVQHYSTADAVWYMLRFFNGAGSAGGAITLNTSTLATAYTTSSDYRLKNTIAPMTGALAKVALLKPCTYKWNADGSDGEGFIAHELAEVVPQCVTGEKDAVDAEGKPQYQGIDTSFLVATLTAAIQEQQALIQTLTARVAALESN
jgi:hypothetical protein